MRLICGVDGGQSSTVAALSDLDGDVDFVRGIGPPADLVGEPAGSTRHIEAISAAIHDALAKNDLGLEAPLAAIVVGLTGFDEEGTLPLPFPNAAVRVVHDSLTAHAGVLGGKPGIVAIAGTGSVVLGTDHLGGSARAGGWGFLFGDGGSGFALGRGAISQAMTYFDRGDRSAFEPLVLAHFGVRSLRAVQSGFASGAIGRPAIAALASGVLDLADAGEAEAARLVRSGAHALVASVRAVNARLAPAGLRDLSYAGGLFASPTFVAAFTQVAETPLPAKAAAAKAAPAKPPADATLLFTRAPLGDAASGALALAARLAGVETS